MKVSKCRTILASALILFAQLVFISFVDAQQVTLNLGDGFGTPGGTASVQLTLDKGGESVSAVAMDIAFDTDILMNPRAEISLGTDRELISSEPSSGVFRIGIIPASLTQQSLEAIIPDGLVATVTFDISSSAIPGTTATLTNTPSASTSAGQALPSIGTNGTVTITNVASISLLVDSPVQPRGVEFPVRIQVGTATDPVTDLFGLSFKLDYTNTAIIDAVEVDIAGSFLGAGADVTSLDDIDDDNGLVSIGITRVAGVGGVDGYGVVAQVVFRFADTAPIGGQSTLSLRDVTANASDSSPIALEITPTSIAIELGRPVWPGDTNNDGIVDERDVLPVGIYWHITGPPRTCHPPQREASWQAHSALDWTPEAAIYADANGDGIIDGQDIMVICLNWHKTHDVGTNAAAPLAGVDHRKHLKAYKELYRALGNAPEVESNIRMRQFLAQIIADALPRQNVLSHNFPNPFNPDTWIPYELAEPAEVKICIYNANGQLIRTLDLGYRDSGYYLAKTQAAYWDGRNDQGEQVSSGLYFCQMQAGSFSATAKMILLR